MIAALLGLVIAVGLFVVFLTVWMWFLSWLEKRHA